MYPMSRKHQHIDNDYRKEHVPEHIFWIASYPKSGNTLIRALISSLFFSDEGLFDFSMLKNIPIIEDIGKKFFNSDEFIKNIKLENIHYENSNHWLILTNKNVIKSIKDAFD